MLGVSDPADVTRTVGSVFGRKDAVLQMQRLASEAGQTPEGREGLRKAVVDYMTGPSRLEHRGRDVGAWGAEGRPVPDVREAEHALP